MDTSAFLSAVEESERQAIFNLMGALSYDGSRKEEVLGNLLSESGNFEGVSGK